MKSILRSPLHGLISKNIMLITFTGRKSNKVYSTPVNYSRENNEIVVFSLRQRVWWRNLKGGVPVTVRIRGQDFKAKAEAVQDPKAVASGLLAYLQKKPSYAKYFQVILVENGQPNSEEVEQSAQSRVIIKIHLTE